MSDIGGDVSTIVMRMTSELSREAAKMTNESVKQMLIFLINKAREQGDQAGEKSLKKLLQSNDEIKLFDLDKKHLKEFSDKCKKYKVSYTVIEDQGRYSVFYKQSEEVRVKNIIENLIKEELSPVPLTMEKVEPRLELSVQVQPFDIVDESSIRVHNAVLDLSIDFQRELAEREGIVVNEIVGDRKQEKNIEFSDVKAQSKVFYEVEGEGEISVKNAVLDVNVSYQRELVEKQGINVSEIVGDFSNRPGDEERYQKAVQFAKEAGEITIPSLQNELTIGYSEARRLVDRMEAEGLLSIYEGTKAQQYIGDQQKTAEMQQPIVEVPEPQSDVLESTPRIHVVQQDLQEKTQEQKYERIEGSKIRVSSITLDMKIAEHRQLAESYGIKVNEIDFKRETSDLVIEKAEVRGRESLVEKLGVAPNERDDNRSAMIQGFFQNVNTRLGLDEKRQQIRPLIEAQKQAPPVKNKNKERGGR